MRHGARKKPPLTKAVFYVVAGVGLEPTASRLWAWRAANCSTPRCSVDIKVSCAGLCCQPGENRRTTFITLQVYQVYHVGKEWTSDPSVVINV